MSILDGWRRLFGDFKSAFSGFFSVTGTSAGELITDQSVLTLSAYYACVRSISEDIGKLPVRVYDEDGDPVKGDLFNLLNKKPNNMQNAITFKETLSAWALGWGNGYAEIFRDDRGNIIELVPIHPSRVQVESEKSGSTFELKYKISTGEDKKEIEAENMFHLHGLGDGIEGWSVARMAAETLGIALAQQTYAGSFYGNGTSLGGVLEHPDTLSQEAQERLRKSWEQIHAKAKNAHKVAILEQGLTWKPNTVNPRDAQFIEGRQFQIEEIARWFRMPPHKIQQLLRSTFSNIEHQAIEYINDTLSPWLVRWEQEIERKLTTDEIEFDVRALMRGDSAQRSAFYASGIQNAWLTPNEVRTFERLPRSDNPLADQLFIQGGTFSLSNAQITDNGDNNA